MKFSIKHSIFLILIIAFQYLNCDQENNNEEKPDPVSITYKVKNISISGATDGAIDITVSGGTPPYIYSWSTGSDNEDVSNLGTGTYTLTVTDQLNQKASVTITLSDLNVTDIDGNIYETIEIGSQTWMKQNLKVTKNPEGNTIESYSYNDDTENAEIYGRLYTWDAAMDGSMEQGAQGICPCGWHIPADEEWKTLEIYLGMTQQEADMENTWRGTGIGTKLKKGGESGYEAMLSGRRSSSGTYSLLNQFEYVWTSSEYGLYAWRRCLDINSNQVGRWNTFPKSYAFSVRCVKDN